jgi:hypothetical protein
MSRNQLTPKTPSKFDATSPIFTVDSNGGVLPTATQTVVRNGSLLIQRDPASASTYSGYVCAWQSGGGCKCSTLIANLRGEPHMKIDPSAYTISATAPIGNNYTIYATTSSSGGGGPSPMASVGDIHVGG